MLERKQTACAKWFLSGCFLLCLHACITPSPLTAQDKVLVEGRVFSQQGVPQEGLMAELNLPWLQRQKSILNSEGAYHFELSGKQTITGIAAADLDVVLEDKEGATLTQSFKALKTSMVLPNMYFWNQLETPHEQAVLKNAPDFDFSWTHARPEAQKFVFSLANDQGTLWQQETTDLVYQLPSEILDANASYRWQVRAEYSDYQASTAWREVLTGSMPFKALPIASITGPDGAMPELFDGKYARSNADREIDFHDAERKQLLIRLEKKMPVSALHWVGSGFTTDLEVRATPDGPLLNKKEVKNYHLLKWPELEIETLFLTLGPEQGGFVRVREIRIIGRD